ncbi:MAG TPA: alpha-amylase family glycosyl hydrolase [Candidatus Binataceae bacterium]
MEQRNWSVGPRIYNLFPLLAGPMPHWKPHIERARAMEFNWLFVNPIQQSGYSRSLYSIKDYYAIDPRLLDAAAGAPEEQLRAMIGAAKDAGMGLIMDLVINHTAFDSPLVREHPEWYRRGTDGKPVSPGVQDGDRWVTWGDLAEVDNAASPDRDNLWRYWIELAQASAAAGFNGFRCDAAYKVPEELWRKLIGEVKRSAPGALFFAESLGCPFEDTLKLGRAGFDFIFNSSKWWDFTAPWGLAQYRQTSAVVPSISFAESHDTERLAAELGGDRQAVKMRYAFSALFSTGVMMPTGFEYGFRRRLDVVKTVPDDWEEPAWDLTGFIAAVNRLKASRRVFNEEGPIEAVDCGNPALFAFRKSSRDGAERALVVLNKDRTSAQLCDLSRLGREFVGASGVEDLSPEARFDPSAGVLMGQIEPSGVRVVAANYAGR